MLKSVVLANLFATIFMTGVIWVIQVVHYQLFNRVGVEGFSVYQSSHMSLITYVVMLPMLLEAGTAFLLVLSPPEGVPAAAMWVGLGLVMVIWFSTLFLQTPQHSVLVGGFNDDAYRTLLTTNWIRTVAWTARSALMLWVLGRLLNAALVPA